MNFLKTRVFEKPFTFGDLLVLILILINIYILLLNISSLQILFYDLVVY